MTGKQDAISKMMRISGIRADNQPAEDSERETMAAVGNCSKMELSVVQPKVETMRGPKPEMAPLMV